MTPLLSVALLLGASANLFIYSARALEPLRASLLEHLDVALVPLLTFMTNRHTKKGMFRSALVAIGATLLILWYDPLAAQEQYVRANARSMWGISSSSFSGDDSRGLSSLSRRSATATSLASIPTPFLNPAQGAIPDEFGNLDLVPLPQSSDEGNNMADDSLAAPLSPEEEQLLGGEDVGEEDALLLNPASKRMASSSGSNNYRAPRRTRKSETEVDSETEDGGNNGRKAAIDEASSSDADPSSSSSSSSEDVSSSATTETEETGAVASIVSDNTDSVADNNVAEPNEIPPPDTQLGDEPASSDGEVAGPSSLGGEDQQQAQTEPVAEEEQQQQDQDQQTEPEQPVEPNPSPILLPRSRPGINRGPRMLAEVGKRGRAGGGRGGPVLPQKKGLTGDAVKKGQIPPPRTRPLTKNPPPSASPSGAPAEQVVSPPPLPASPESQEGGTEEDLSSSSTTTSTDTTDKKKSGIASLPSKEKLTMRSMGDKAARSVLKQAQKIRNVVEKHERSSVFLAGLLMACAAWLNTMRRRLERQLADDTKMGHVKLHGIVLITAAVMWAPVAVLRWSFSSGGSSESETRAVAEALDALSTGAQVASSASNSVLEVVNLKLANTADAVLLHAGPGIVWFVLVAALFGIVHHVLAEWATDYLQFGGSGERVGGGGGGKNQPPSIVAVLTGQATSGGGGGGGVIASSSGSGGYQSGGSLPHHSIGGGGGSSSAASSGGAGAVKSLQGGSIGGSAASPDAPLLRTFAMVCTFASAFFLAWLTGWGYQSSFLLWFGASVFSLGIAGSAGLESNQFERVFGVLLRGSVSSPSSASSQVLNLLFSSLSMCWSMVSGEGHRTYSAEAGGLVPGGGSSSSAQAAKAWFSGKDSGIGGIPDAAPPSVSFAVAARKVLKHILDDSNSRKIFYFLCINFTFMFVEIVGGYFTNSLGLISDAGHMFFDNASLFIGLYASYMSRWRSDAIFTYGYSRYEVLAGFVNAVFLVFIGVSVVIEGVSRLWQPPDIHTEHLLPISIAGLGVNIIGLIFFHDVAHAHGHGGGGDEGGHGDCDGHHGHSHGGGGGANENMMGVYLHVLADALGSIGVIISSLMIKYWGWKLADPIASIIISGLILASVIPLLNVTVGPLLQRVPENSEGKLRAACATLAKSPDIARIENVHFWKLRGDMTVGTLHVIARKEADEQRVLRRVQAQFKALGVLQLTAQIERDDTVCMAQTQSTLASSIIE